MAVTVAKRLGAYYQGKNVAVVSVFIQADVSSNYIPFIEDFLGVIYGQLSKGAIGGDESDKPYERYKAACKDGLHCASRMSLIKNALSTKLETTEHSFLILDGYDHGDKTLQFLLDPELESLQRRGVSVMLTRRVPVFERPLFIMYCDNCSTGYLQLYWVCQECDEDTCFTLCYACKDTGPLCQKHRDAGSMKEPYAHVDFNLGQLPDESVSQFATWSLEMEYGKLTLDTDRNIEFPGSSPLSEDTTQKLALFIAINSSGNIAIAKIWLEEIYNSNSLEDATNPSDGLPRGIIALFDAGIRHIERQDPVIRDLALMAVAAAGGDDIGVPLSLLGRWMRDAVSRLKHLARAPPRSLEEILQATKGFLVMQLTAECHIASYSPAFSSYVRENYNDSLFWARNQLAFDKISRTLTRIQPTLSASPEGTPLPSSNDIFLDQDSGYFGSRTSSTTSTPAFEFTMPRKSATMVALNSSINALADASIVNPRHATNIDSASRRKSSIEMICSTCRGQILEAKRSWGYYHDSLKNLEASAANGCVFCTKMYREINDYQLRNPGPIGWPLYYWTIRTNAKIIEVKESVIITFRPVNYAQNWGYDTQKGSPKLSRATTLPTRTYYMFPEDDLGHIPEKKELGGTTNPTITKGHQIEKWIHDCDRNHPGCVRQGGNEFVPTRLLDVDTGILDIIRVVETATSNINGPYVTLSHAWGTTPFLTLTIENKEGFIREGINLLDLPKNFQHAISVARQLRIRYIWIDSLCIIQGKGSDFLTEGHLMHKVYRFSYCNIVAADSVNSDGGLFRDRDPRLIIPVKYRADGTSPVLGWRNWRIFPEDVWDSELLRNHIYKRAWVFQGKTPCSCPQLNS